MGSDKQPKEPFEAPVAKEKKKKREKVKKERIHVYLSQDCIDKIDEKAAEIGLDRSPCIQMLCHTALKKMNNKNE